MDGNRNTRESRSDKQKLKSAKARTTGRGGGGGRGGGRGTGRSGGRGGGRGGRGGKPGDNGNSYKNNDGTGGGKPNSKPNSAKVQHRQEKSTGQHRASNNGPRPIKNPSGGRGRQQQQRTYRPQQPQRHGGSTAAATKHVDYPPHLEYSDCLARYNNKDPTIIRGRIRVLGSANGMAFCSCDRGLQKKDVLLTSPLERNRAIDGDTVFVELLPEEGQEGTHIESKTVASAEDSKEPEEEDSKPASIEIKQPIAIKQPIEIKQPTATSTAAAHAPAAVSTSNKGANSEDDAGDKVTETWWQDDAVQMDLWAPVVRIVKKSTMETDTPQEVDTTVQRKGRVLHIIPPDSLDSEINPNSETRATIRNIVGTMVKLQSGTCLLTCSTRAMPQFKCSQRDADLIRDDPPDSLYLARYVYGSWKEDMKWPPCVKVSKMGTACNVEDETKALLITHQVDHGEFPQPVLEECGNQVESGEFVDADGEAGWKPTPEMYEGRRDFRKKRIFTIDPTTARDLDDALHIEDLGNGYVEVGVHIADVSHFVTPNSLLDIEAQRRCTTVYLVDRVIPMLPRPLCEIACSLNENVERLAFSCVWKMRKNGNLTGTNGVDKDSVWYGRSVIRSCARLDYSTAQNIIEKKCGKGETDADDEFWPASRRPTGGHTTKQVAADVRLMNVVARARRKLRFQNGALALSAVKLTFQLAADRETPLLCEPYIIRESNQLVEEYMLLANYLVAQRLITHADTLALLRNHESPMPEGLKKVQKIARDALGFQLNISSSQGLQRSLERLSKQGTDNLNLQCITELLKTPLRPAAYLAAGDQPEDAWAHYALNIPYYTHFTSPIRRYADVMVHRLLQATLDGEEAVEDFIFPQQEVARISTRCNDKKDASRLAQERSDIVFLSLFVRKTPLTSQLGVVVSVGQTAFTVFMPKLGVTKILYLAEHEDWISAEPFTNEDGSERRIKLEQTKTKEGEDWETMTIEIFTKVRVTCFCKDKPPIDVKLLLEGPWNDE